MQSITTDPILNSGLLFLSDPVLIHLVDNVLVAFILAVILMTIVFLLANLSLLPLLSLILLFAVLLGVFPRIALIFPECVRFRVSVSRGTL